MRLDTSQNVKLSSVSPVHILGVVTNCELGPNTEMARTIRDIAARLIATQQAFDMKPAEFCKKAGITQTEWTQFTDHEYKRRITVKAAQKLVDTYHVDLNWIYDGRTEMLPSWLAKKLEAGRAA